MKEALKRVFSDMVEDENPINSSFLDVPIKQENVCYAQLSNKQKKTKQGIISRCTICDSKMHWAKECYEFKLLIWLKLMTKRRTIMSWRR